MSAPVQFHAEPHSFTKRACGFAYCGKCGLVWLNNFLSEAARRLGCNHQDHKSWPSLRHQAAEMRKS